MDANEREMYRAAIHGDREAFAMIIRRHSRALFAIAYGILQNREEAEDAVQDALVKAWKSRWRVRNPEKFPAWLCMIARHRARDVFRKRRTVPISDEMDYRTIENTLGLSNGSLRGILGRALASMRKELRPALVSLE